jgi:hypothetical protein
VGTYIPDEHDVSIFRAEDGGNMSQENNNMSFHGSENFKSDIRK